MRLGLSVHRRGPWSRRLRVLACALLGPGIAFGCETISVTTVDVSSIEVSPEGLSLTVGQEVQFSAEVQGPSGVPLSGRAVVWSTSDTDRATVNQNGVVRGESPGPVQIRATAEGVTGSASITVASQATIALSQSQVTFTVPVGAGPTNPVPIDVTNAGEGVLSGLSTAITYTQGAVGWLEAPLSPTTAPATINLRALPGAVPAGTHNATVEVRSAAAGNSPRTILVTLEVQAGPPAVRVSPETVTFTGETGQAPPPPQVVAVTNGGGGSITGLQVQPISYAFGQTPGWLAAQLNGTTAPAQLTLTVSPTGLAPNVRYEAEVRLTSPSAPGSDGLVRVFFDLGTPPTTIQLSTKSVALQIPEGGLPAPAIIQVQNGGSGTLGNLSVNTTFGPGATGWLQGVLAQTIAPTTLTLSANPLGLLPGVYTAQVNVASPEASNTPQVIEVVLTVRPRPSPTFSIITANPVSIVANGVNTSTILVSLRDVRNDPITVGGNLVQLETTAGTLGAVTDLGNGTHRAILTSSTLVGSASIVGRVNGEVLFDGAQVQFVPGAPAAIELTGPATMTADAPSGNFTLRVLDAFGNETVVPDNAQFTLTTTSAGTASFTPPNPITIAAGQSRVTFTYADNRAATPTVTATWLNGGTNLGMDTYIIQVLPGARTALRVVTQPVGGVSGEPLGVQPVVEVIDAHGNRLTADNTTVVTASIFSGAGGSLGPVPMPSATATGGVATFAGVTLSGTLLVDYVLQFSAAPALPTPTVNSAAVQVVGAGTPTQLSLATPPSSTVQAGVPFPVQPSVQLRDAGNNPVGGAGREITALIFSGGGTLQGTVTALTNGSGVATFTNLAIAGTVGPRTIRFTSTLPAPALTPVTSGTITVNAGPAATLTIQTQPSPAVQSGVAFAQQPVIRVADASNNPVAGILVTASRASGAVALGGTLTATTNASGLATFTNLAFAGTVGDRTLNFAATGLTTATSNTVTVSAGPASALTIQTQPSAAAQSGMAFAIQPVLRVADAANNPVSGVLVTASIDTGLGALMGTVTATTDASGLASFTNLRIDGLIGNRTLRFTAGALTPALSGAIVVSAGAAATMTIQTQPSASVQNGVAFPQQPVIRVEDAWTNPVTGALVTASIATGGGTQLGTWTATTVASGLATFSGLAISGSTGNRTLQFVHGALAPVVSGTVTVTPGPPASLSIQTQPSTTATNGVAFAQQPVILVRDGSLNPVQGVVVTVAISGGDPALGPGPSLTATSNASGLATFSGLTITGVTGLRTLQFTSGAVPAATSTGITVSAGAATQLTLTTQPSPTAGSGVAFAQQPAVQLRDGSGNAVSLAGVTITVGIQSGDPALGPGPSLTAVTNSSGVATFAGLTITGVPGVRTLQFTSGALTPVTSDPVTVGAGAATQLTITTQPSPTAASGVAFLQQPVVQLRDGSGTAVNQAGVTITVGIQTGDPTLGPGPSLTAVTNASGVATFAGLTITGVPGARTLQFTSGALTPATSNAVTVAAATQLTITTQPSPTAASGVAFAQQPAVQLRDGSGNAVSLAGVTITVGIQSGDPALGPGPSLTAVTNSTGVATFAGLTITGVPGARTLQFTSGALTPVTSDPVTVGAGAATQLTITTQPSPTAASGVAFLQQPVVQLRDGSGTAVNQAGVTITVGIQTGDPALGPGPSLTAVTNASGVATFVNLTITGVPGARTLQFTSGALTPVTSNAVTVAAATQLTITTQPSPTAASGVAFAQQPAVQLRDGSGNAVHQAGVTITVGLLTGDPALGPGPSLTATTNSTGVATFAGLTITGVPGERTLQFTSGALTPVTSNAVTVPVAAQVTITTQPSPTATSGVAFAQQPVVQLRDGSGNAVHQAGVTITVGIQTGDPALGPGPSLTAVTNASGLATFVGLTITGVPGARTLQFTSGALTPVTSDPVTVDP